MDDTFALKYLVDKTYFNETVGGPILFYAGNEGAIEGFYENSGFITKTLAEELGAYVVFAEHRYYGTSIPPNGFEKENLKYLSVLQVMMDYVKLIEYVRKLNGLEEQPTILFGGSYGGMLAAWMRMKYPQHFQGAIASSAPILWFNGTINPSAYTDVASGVFKSMGGQECFDGLKYGFFDLVSVQFDKSKYAQVKEIFNLCDDLTSKDDVQDLISYVSDSLGSMAMVNYPYPTEFLNSLPAWPVKESCTELKKIPDINETDKEAGTPAQFKFNNIQKLQAAANLSYNYTGNLQCLNLTADQGGSLDGSGWEIQTCNEFPMPMGDDPSVSCFTWQNWNQDAFTQNCMTQYGMTPKYDWALDYFGGRNPALDFAKASNIVFSNGQLDPWHAGGITANITENTIALYIKDSAHHLDLREPNAADPVSVTEARAVEMAYVKKWVSHYKTRIASLSKYNAREEIGAKSQVSQQKSDF
uniref:Lysosomal Pro-X carboxypeptidase n=1 Tax=Strombidium rassoulzadegani TaxID=1082188 RepID=A0A7S3CRA2_9SPIT|mmetsp:Transcript_4391/g.7435  ORF Transcript_4391/g.7435 Transcript_4391/m.7435 type:complete len:472 (+) Transcript_4391:265-1680(+)